jgi:hypothetical protein
LGLRTPDGLSPNRIAIFGVSHVYSAGKRTSSKNRTAHCQNADKDDLVFCAVDRRVLRGAGHLDWARGWIFVALYLVGMTAILPIVRHYNPTLMEAREKWRHKDTKRFDRTFLAALLPLVFIQPAVAGLYAVRFRWSVAPRTGVIPIVATSLSFSACFLVIWYIGIARRLVELGRIITDDSYEVLR